jgi:ribosomal protein S18 acetylase RimI-like enzyme
VQEVVVEQYPKAMKTKDGTSILVRPLTTNDGSALLAFFRALPDDDRLFLREDVTREDVIARRIAEVGSGAACSVIAEHASRMVGHATLHFNLYGWSRHVAEIRCVVAPEHRREGIGTILMKELLGCGDSRGVRMISAEVMDTQLSAQHALQRLGFKKAAELKSFVTDIKGQTHSLIVMVNEVSELWKTMEDLLIDYDVRPERWA